MTNTGFMGRVRASESGGNDSARAETSTATGRYQFIDQTWKSMYKRAYPGSSLSEEAVLALRSNGEVQDKVMQATNGYYEEVLGRAGLGATDTNKYVAHFFGAETAAKVLKAPGDTPIVNLVGEQAVAANERVLRGKSVSQVVAWADSKMGGQGTGAVAIPPAALGPLFGAREIAGIKDTLTGVFAERPAAPHHANTPKMDSLKSKLADAAALGVGQAAAPDTAPTGFDQAVEAADAGAKEQAAKDANTFGDKSVASFKSTMTATVLRAVEREHFEGDPAWNTQYIKNREELERGYEDDADELRSSTSAPHLDQIKQGIDARRERDAIVFSGGTASGLGYSLLGGAADPLGFLLGFGVGKGFQMAGVGSNALFAAGRTGAGVASLAGEGAIGGLAFSVGLDAAGEHMTSADVAAFAGFGALINGAAGGVLHMRGKKPDTGLSDFYAAARTSSAEAKASLIKRAEANVGTDPVAVDAEVRRLDVQDKTDFIRDAMGEVPDERRLFGVDEKGAMLLDDAAREAIVTRHGLDAMPDPAIRAVGAEMVARAERVLASNPVNTKALGTILKVGGLESTANTLLSSDNVLAKAVGTLLLENSQGAAGRKATAAISQHMNEMRYMSEMAQFDNMYTMFRKGEGIGQLTEIWTSQGRKQFNRRVFAEIEARGSGIASAEQNKAILSAADMLENGYDRMRIDSQTAGIVGAARLGAERSRGYQPHRIQAARAALLMQNKGQRRAVAAVLSRQLQSEANAFEHVGKDGVKAMKRWDKEFADKFAAKYLDDAARRAQGGWDIPLNLHDPQAADVVFDTAKALNLSPEQADQLLGKFSRGGAGHTKARLRLDLSESIPDGKGGQMQLMDLFNQDAVGLYRSYARRTSGEVALAQYGIMGKKGMETLRDTMRVTGASNETLRAFDQIAAEFLNTPFGEANHKFLDNVRLAVSTSRLGGMGFTQLGEYGNAIPAIGVAGMLRAMKDFRRLVRETGQLAAGEGTTNAILKSLDVETGGVGVGQYHLTRFFDGPDDDIQMYGNESIGLFTKALRAGANIQAVVSGHRMITAAQTRGMAEQILRKAFKYVQSGADDTALNDMGIDGAMRARLKSNVDKIATFEKGKLSTLDLHAGDLTPVELSDLRQAILRGSSQIIQHTYIGETGKWAHNGFLKLLTQFRTFSLVSVEKQWGRNSYNHGVLKSFMYLMGAMSFAVPIHLARVHARSLGMSGSEREKYLDRNLSLATLGRATLGYSSLSGLAGDGYDAAVGFAGGWTGADTAATFGVRGQGQGSITGLVPGFGLADDAWKAANGNTAKLDRLLPFGNLPYVQPLINGLAAE